MTNKQSKRLKKHLKAQSKATEKELAAAWRNIFVKSGYLKG